MTCAARDLAASTITNLPGNDLVGRVKGNGPLGSEGQLGDFMPST